MILPFLYLVLTEIDIVAYRYTPRTTVALIRPQTRCQPHESQEIRWRWPFTPPTCNIRHPKQAFMTRTLVYIGSWAMNVVPRKASMTTRTWRATCRIGRYGTYQYFDSMSFYCNPPSLCTLAKFVRPVTVLAHRHAGNDDLDGTALFFLSSIDE